MLQCVRFFDESDICDYVRKHGIEKDQIQSIVYNDTQRLYWLLYWS